MLINFYHMNILKIFENRYYKLAYQCGLSLGGIENGKPQWLGTQEQLDKYFSLIDGQRNSNGYYNFLKA